MTIVFFLLIEPKKYNECLISTDSVILQYVKITEMDERELQCESRGWPYLVCLNIQSTFVSMKLNAMSSFYFLDEEYTFFSFFVGWHIEKYAYFVVLWERIKKFLSVTYENR